MTNDLVKEKYKICYLCGSQIFGEEIPAMRKPVFREKSPINLNQDESSS